LELSEAEAKELAKAYDRVAQFYPVMNLDKRVAAIVNLGSVVAVTYGTRIITYRSRKARERGIVRAKPIIEGMPATSAPMPPAPDFSQVNGNKPAPQPKPGPVPVEIRTGEIPGVGRIVFPEDDPMFGRKH